MSTSRDQNAYYPPLTEREVASVKEGVVQGLLGKLVGIPGFDPHLFERAVREVVDDEETWPFVLAANQDSTVFDLFDDDLSPAAPPRSAEWDRLVGRPGNEGDDGRPLPDGPSSPGGWPQSVYSETFRAVATLHVGTEAAGVYFRRRLSFVADALANVPPKHPVQADAEALNWSQDADRILRHVAVLREQVGVVFDKLDVKVEFGADLGDHEPALPFLRRQALLGGGPEDRVSPNLLLRDRMEERRHELTGEVDAVLGRLSELRDERLANTVGEVLGKPASGGKKKRSRKYDYDELKKLYHEVHDGEMPEDRAYKIVSERYQYEYGGDFPDEKTVRRALGRA